MMAAVVVFAPTLEQGRIDLAALSTVLDGSKMNHHIQEQLSRGERTNFFEFSTSQADFCKHIAATMGLLAQYSGDQSNHGFWPVIVAAGEVAAP